MTAVEPEEVTIYFEKTPIMSTYVSRFGVDFPQQKDFPQHSCKHWDFDGDAIRKETLFIDLCDIHTVVASC